MEGWMSAATIGNGERATNDKNGVYILLDHRESAPLAALPVPVSLLSEVGR